MDSRGKRRSRDDYMPIMTWINFIDEELPRMRLYASAALGSPAKGDLAVEAALGVLFEAHLASPRGRVVLFRLRDRQLRSLSRLPASERVELLKHICGFSEDEARAIVNWEAPDALRPAG